MIITFTCFLIFTLFGKFPITRWDKYAVSEILWTVLRIGPFALRNVNDEAQSGVIFAVKAFIIILYAVGAFAVYLIWLGSEDVIPVGSWYYTWLLLAVSWIFDTLWHRYFFDGETSIGTTLFCLSLMCEIAASLVIWYNWELTQDDMAFIGNIILDALILLESIFALNLFFVTLESTQTPMRRKEKSKSFFALKRKHD